MLMILNIRVRDGTVYKGDLLVTFAFITLK
jgi:hypothetical protein